MDIKNIPANTVYKQKTYQSCNAINFTATPKQILKAVNKSNLSSDNSNILRAVANAFKYIKKEAKAATMSYKLGEKNEIPQCIARKQAGEHWKKIDEELNRGPKQYLQDVRDTSEQDHTLGKDVKKLLTQIGVEAPDKITL